MDLSPLFCRSLSSDEVYSQKDVQDVLQSLNFAVKVRGLSVSGPDEVSLLMS
jgi:hypothetical protein